MRKLGYLTFEKMVKIRAFFGKPMHIKKAHYLFTDVVLYDTHILTARFLSSTRHKIETPKFVQKFAKNKGFLEKL